MGVDLKKLNTFVRFGGLDIKVQKGHRREEESGYHSPPSTRGFYAMPKVAQEFFLISSLEKTQPGIFPKKPKEGETWEEYRRREKKLLRNIRKEFVRKDGYVWHHLGEYVPVKEVVSRHGSWVRTSITAWKKAFMKSSMKCRYDSGGNSINGSCRAGLFGIFSKDHLEVFFDEKV
jgi:hypothetical protein